jgi:hypothetical protein
MNYGNKNNKDINPVNKEFEDLRIYTIMFNKIGSEKII